MENDHRGGYQPPEEQSEQAYETKFALESSQISPGEGEPYYDRFQNPSLPPGDLAERDPRLTELLSLLYQTHTLQRDLLDAAAAASSQETLPLSPTQAIERYDVLRNID